MATFTRFDCFTEDLAEGAHNLGSDTLNLMLTNTAPVVTNTTITDITEIAAANGYTAGGAAAAVTSSTQTAGAYKLILGDVTFTASGGTIGPFRYIVLYNDTATGKNLIAFADYGINYTIADGQAFTVDFDADAGALTLA